MTAAAWWTCRGLSGDHPGLFRRGLLVPPGGREGEAIIFSGGEAAGGHCPGAAQRPSGGLGGRRHSLSLSG